MRGMSNALGEFHQTVLGSATGWEDHDAGYDLKSDERKIIAEVKNKWNTMNANDRREVEDNLSAALRNMNGTWVAYLVTVIPRTPKRFSKALRKNVIEIDGASFYEIVTGTPNAIHELFDALSRRLAPSDEIATYCQDILKNSLPPRM